MTRLDIRLVAVSAASAMLASILTWTMLSTASAQDVPTSVAQDVECVQVPQMNGMVDEAFVERFMSGQVALGRKRFESIRGLSTLLCAW